MRPKTNLVSNFSLTTKWSKYKKSHYQSCDRSEESDISAKAKEIRQSHTNDIFTKKEMYIHEFKQNKYSKTGIHISLYNNGIILHKKICLIGLDKNRWIQPD
jgi:hypothetical protein